MLQPVVGELARRKIPQDLLRELPSRQCGVVLESSDVPRVDGTGGSYTRTLRLRTAAGDTSSEDRERQQLLEDVLEGYMKFDDGEHEAEDELLRQAVGPLQLKREIRRQLQLMEDQPDAVTGTGTVRKLQRQISARRSAAASSKTQMRRKVSRMWHWIAADWNLWNKQLHFISGNHGSGMGSFFFFIKMFFLLHTSLSVLFLGFILVPQILAIQYPESATEPAINASARSLYDITARTLRKGSTFSASDVLYGDGYFQDTVIYYGTYSDKILEVWGSLEYNIPLAYLACLTSTFILSVLVLGRVAAVSYRRHFIFAEGVMKNRLVSSLFSGWDFSITARSTAEQRKRSVYMELRDYVDSLKRSTDSWWEVSTLLVVLSGLLLMTGAVALLSLVLDPSVYRDADWLPNLQSNLDRDNVTMAVIIPIVLPVFLASIGAIFFSVISRVRSTYSQKETADSLTMQVSMACLLLLASLAALVVTSVDRLREESEDVCWESQLGALFYRFFFWDVILMALVVPVIRSIWWQLYQLFFRSPSKPVQQEEGPVPLGEDSQTLSYPLVFELISLLYSHTLVLLAVFFAPLLLPLSALRFAAMFYVKKWTIYGRCRIRAAKVEPVFLAWAFILTFCASVFFFYLQVNVPTSQQCGPFQSVKVIADALVEISSESFLLKVIIFLRRGGVKFVLLIGLVAWAYFMRYVSATHKDIAEVLRFQLSLQRLDKQFLLNQISILSSSAVKPNNRHAVKFPPAPMVASTSSLASMGSASGPPEMLNVSQFPNTPELPEFTGQRLSFITDPEVSTQQQPHEEIELSAPEHSEVEVPAPDYDDESSSVEHSINSKHGWQRNRGPRRFF